MLRRVGLAATLALTLGMATAARAQGTVPGGWGPDVGYQVAGGNVAGGVNLYTGWNTPWYGSGAAYSPFGVYQPSLEYSGPPVVIAPPARTVNALGPFGQVVQRSARTRRSR